MASFSLGVVGSAAFVGLGPVADLIIGLLITLVILKITWDSWRTVSKTGAAASFRTCTPARWSVEIDVDQQPRKATHGYRERGSLRAASSAMGPNEQ